MSISAESFECINKLGILLASAALEVIQANRYYSTVAVIGSNGIVEYSESIMEHSLKI